MRLGRFRTRRLIGSVAAFVVVGCGSKSDPVSPQQQIAGVYTLQSVNGQALPYKETTAGVTVALISDVLTLNADGTLLERTVAQFTDTNGASSTQTTPDTGTWTASGTAVTVHFNSDNSTSTGTFTGGNTITVALNGYSGVYRK